TPPHGARESSARGSRPTWRRSTSSSSSGWGEVGCPRTLRMPWRSWPCGSGRSSLSDGSGSWSGCSTTSWRLPRGSPVPPCPGEPKGMLNSEVGSCPECGSSVELDSYRAETVCVGCSIVVEHSLVEPTPSVKTDDNGIRQEYHSGPPSLPFGSKMTYIRVGRGATGKTL